MNMPGMGGMPMAQAASAGSSFAMWLVMMPAMMLPALAASLWRYRQAAGATPVRMSVAMIGAGYVTVWAAFGTALFPLGAVAAEAQARWPALAGVTVIAVSLLQFTRWKARRLACCREAPARGADSTPDALAAVRHGVRLGGHCVACCVGPMATLLVIGMMDWRAMVAVMAAITFERIAPSPDRAARIVGLLGLAAGAWLCQFAPTSLSV